MVLKPETFGETDFRSIPSLSLFFWLGGRLVGWPNRVDNVVFPSPRAVPSLSITFARDLKVSQRAMLSYVVSIYWFNSA